MSRLVGYWDSQYKNEGIHVNPFKVDAILKLPPMSTICQLQNLQGKANFLRRFIVNYTEITKGFVNWVIYYPFSQLLDSRGICIGPASNNVVEYTVVVNLLSELISLGIDSLVVYLDPQLVVSQLNNIYHVRDPYLYRQFLKVILLQRSFIYIIFIHIPQ